MTVGKKFQNIFGIVTNRGEFKTLFLESSHGALQLNQLPFAEGSPVRGTKKEEHRSLGTFEGIQCLQSTRLIAQ